MEKKVLFGLCASAMLMMMSCADSGTVKECENGAFKCESNVLSQCFDGQWNYMSYCTNKQTCSDTLGTCVNNSEIGGGDDKPTGGDDKPTGGDDKPTKEPCTVKPYCDNNAVVQCVGDEKQTTPCNDKLCTVSGESASCVERVCEEYAVECKDASTKRVCTNNAWVETSCLDDKICNAAQKDCVERTCTENAMRCNNNAVETCLENSWKQTEACGSEKMCSDNTCKAITCNDGDLRCNNGKVEKCIDKSRFEAIEDCDKNNQLCQTTGDNKAACVAKICDEGSFQCVASSGMLQKCEGNAWKDSVKCDSQASCNAQKGVCDECVSGYYGCNDKTLVECIDGHWSKKAECADAKSCNMDARRCDVCSSGEIRCTSNELVWCDNGEWKNKATCDSADLCDATAGVCKKPDAPDCSGDSYQCTTDNELQKCVSGKWQTAQVCSKSKTCNATLKQCDECKAGDAKCTEAGASVCENGKWKTTACNKSQHCDETSHQCAKSDCFGDEMTCVGSVIQKCVNYAYQAGEDCGLASLCDAKDGQAKCLEPMTWCNFQHVDDSMNQGYGRILIEAPLNMDSVQARMACGDLSKPVETWHSASARYNRDCKDCTPNTEYRSYAFHGDEGKYACTFIFDIGNRSYACLPRVSETQDGGAPILITNTLKLTEEQTRSMTIKAFDAAKKPTWCQLTNVNPAEDSIYSEIYMGDNGGTSPAIVDAVVRCTKHKADDSFSMKISEWEVVKTADQNLYFDGNKDHLEYMVDTSELDGKYECAFTYSFGGETYVCPTNAGWEMFNASNDLVDGYYWGAEFAR